MSTGRPNRKVDYRKHPAVAVAPVGMRHNRWCRVIDPRVIAAKQLDPRGGAGDSRHQLRDMCLVDSLRSLGCPIEVHRSGPFRAMEDGNRMLAHTGRRLVPVEYHALTEGSYIRWQCLHRMGHFVAVIIGKGGVQVTDGMRTMHYNRLGSLDPRPDQTLWWRLHDADIDPTVRSANQATHLFAERERFDEVEQAMEATRVLQSQTSLHHRMLDNSWRWSTLSADQQQVIKMNMAQAKRRRDGLINRPHPPPTWVHQAVPDAPTTFASRPVLPTLTFLAVLNRHSRDARIKFFDDTHTYLLDGRPSMGSVTGLIHQYAQPFHAHVIANRMVLGWNWPRTGYLRKVVPVDILVKLASNTATRNIASLLGTVPYDDDAVCSAARAVTRGHPRLRALVNSIALDVDEIIRLWDANRDDAANRGTYMHWRFEAWLNRVNVPQDSETCWCGVVSFTMSTEHLSTM